MQDIPKAFQKRVVAKAAQMQGVTEDAVGLDFMSLIADIIMALLGGCSKPSPEQLAKQLNDPGWLERAHIRREARKMAARAGLGINAGDEAAKVLMAVGGESTLDECRELVEYKREELPVFDLI